MSSHKTIQNEAGVFGLLEQANMKLEQMELLANVRMMAGRASKYKSAVHVLREALLNHASHHVHQRQQASLMT